MNRVSIAAGLVAALAWPLAVHGQNLAGQTGSYFLRGKVTAVQSDRITVTPYSGKDAVTVPLVPGWTVTRISPTDESIVAEGNLVNIVEVDQPDGISWALFVDFLAGRSTQTPAVTSVAAPTGGGVPAARAPQGRAWSQLPGRNQFGAWGTLGRIASVEKTERGWLVVVTWPDGSHKSIVPPGTVMVRNDPSDQSIVKVGENVAVILRKGPQGTPVANRVLVGANGTVPPM